MVDHVIEVFGNELASSGDGPNPDGPSPRAPAVDEADEARVVFNSLCQETRQEAIVETLKATCT